MSLFDCQIYFSLSTILSFQDNHSDGSPLKKLGDDFSLISSFSLVVPLPAHDMEDINQLKTHK